MSQQPFPLADDYVPEADSTPPPSSEEQPFEVSAMTMPQRMMIMERRQLQHTKELQTLNSKMDKVLKVLSWKNTIKTWSKAAAPVLLTAGAAQFPEAKHFLKALLDFISSAQ